MDDGIGADLDARMTGYAAGESGEVSATFLFAPEFSGFRGHFPERPVLPGVCQIQCAMAVLRRWSGRSLSLSAVKRAKFLAPVGPGDEMVVTATVAERDGGCEGDFRLVVGDVAVARMRLFALPAGGQG
jgi:3-hydroxyacyl-[acyl-carrier-protein] dehydratase